MSVVGAEVVGSYCELCVESKEYVVVKRREIFGGHYAQCEQRTWEDFVKGISANRL